MRTVRTVRRVPVLRVLVLVLVLVPVLGATTLHAQDATPSRVVAAVRAAMKPALPYPDTDDAGAVPKDNNTDALWMVRAPEAGESSFEILANPLNEVNQLRATRAMAQIENNIAAAQRKAAAQYDRAVSEAKRTGKSQDVDGITLSDEGVAGAKIDAESHVLIEVAINQPMFTFDIASSIQPAPSTQVSIAGATVIAVPSNTFRDERLDADRFAEAEAIVFLGRMAPPAVQKREDHAFSVTAAADAGDARNLAVRLRGNEVLIAELLRKTDWNSLLELLK